MPGKVTTRDRPLPWWVAAARAGGRPAFRRSPIRALIAPMTVAPQQTVPGQTLGEWRRRATTATLFAAAAVGVPVLVPMMLRDTAPLLRATHVACFLAVLVAAGATRVPPRLRVALFLAAGYAIATVALIRLGLAGNGRTLLLLMPLFALLLVGRRAGVITIAISVAIYAILALLTGLGRLPTPPPQVTGGQWAFQGFMVVMLIAPGAVLLERTLAFREQTLRRARDANARLAAEDEARRQLGRTLIDVAERERQRVGRDLHDGLCQQLTGALITARLLERALDARRAPEAERAGALAEAVSTGLADARGLARDLTLGALPGGGLGGALRELVRRVRETADVSCTLRGDAPSLPVETGTHLYRIAEAAIRGALAGAGVSRIALEVEETHGSVRLTVRDDGLGGPGATATEGLGLRTLEARVRSLGGTVERAPAPGGGTELRCELPLTA